MHRVTGLSCFHGPSFVFQSSSSEIFREDVFLFIIIFREDMMVYKYV